ncbi:MAG: DivIVA domain-containing protein [Oscillospiraceae bacterium]|nr:DivIVA domain-containing protein [Oscillospiraceae bacterium]
MIKAQDIRGITFEKAVFGGYDMASVDSFMEDLANDLGLLQKENAVLRAKMKVLVDKVDEYRSNEDALRTALLTAQKMGLSIEREAREKADALLAEAQAEAGRITGEAQAQVELEHTRLDESRKASVQFLDSMDLLCRRQLEFLRKVEDLDFVKSIRRETAAAAEPEEAPAEQPAPVEAEAPAAEEEDEQPTRTFNLVSEADAG